MDTNTKNINVYWRGHFRSLGVIGSGLCRRKVRCREIDGDHIGYTTRKNDDAEICLNRSHEVVPKELAKASTFIDGIFCHEIGHQLFSDFESQENFYNILKNGSLIHFNEWMSDCDIKAELKKTYSEREIELFHNIWNAIEDTSIEYWLFNTLGGRFPEALKYAILTTYNAAPRIDEIKTAYGQVCAAMINYGDVGLLKGKFTFNEARDAFYNIIEGYDSAIEEPNARRRLAISFVVFEKLRPIWEPMLKSEEMVEEFLKQLSKMMKNGATENSQSGSGKGTYSSDASKASGSESSENNKTKERRKKTIELTRKELEKALKESADSDDSDENGEEVTIKIVDDKDSSADDSDGKSDENKGDGDSKDDSTNEGDSESSGKEESSENSDENADGSDSKSKDNNNTESGDENPEDKTSSGADKSGDDSDSTDFDQSKSKDESGNGEGNDEQGEGTESSASPGVDHSESSSSGSDSSDSNSPLDPSSNPDKKNRSGKNESGDENSDGEPNPEDQELQIFDDCDTELSGDYDEIWEESQLDQETIDRINQEIEEEINKEIFIEKNERNETDVPDFDDIVGKGFTKAKCQNIVIEGVESFSSSYQMLVDKHRQEIVILAGQLKRATERQNINKTKRSSGKISIDRYSKINACQTTKIFDKRRLPDQNDIAIFVNVDESGSMHGDRIMQAKEACVVIAEACFRAKIPIYIMGFTADGSGYDANHRHYVRWKNTALERYSLLNISAKLNNFDGYSIRYSTRMLLKRTENKKLLVVISDGQPAARAYHDGYSNIGVADTSEAVKQATSNGVVVHGIAIGERDNGVLNSIYGVNFTSNESLSLLIRDFSNAILKQLKV